MTTSLAHSVSDIDLSFDQIVNDVEFYSPGIEDVQRVAHGMDRALKFVQGQHVDEFCGRGSFDGISEGRTFTFSITPGTLALSVTDQNKIEKSVAAAFDRQKFDANNVLDEILYPQDVPKHSWYEPYLGDSRGIGSIEDADLSLLEDVDGVFHHDRFAVVGWQDDQPITIMDRFTGELISAPSETRREIMEWSKKSRMRMVRALAELDYSKWSGGALAMVTLTLPGRWEEVAPTGKVFKKLFKRFEARWRRQFGGFQCVWKLEFQVRGAAHIHMLMRVPDFVGDYTFQQWVSHQWADSVDASKVVDGVDKDGNDSSEYSRHLAAGTGVDYSEAKQLDPRRIALYFLGYASKKAEGKEIQNRVPELWDAPGKGPGRFWAHPGFDKCVVNLELAIEDFYKLARQMRKLRRARDWKTGLIRMNGYADANGVDRIPASQIRWRKDKTEALGATGKFRGGWLLFNDALKVCMQLSEWLRVTK